MRRQRKSSYRLLVLLSIFSLIAAACGDDSDDSNDNGDAATDEATDDGAELDEDKFVSMLEDVCGTGDDPETSGEDGGGGGGGEFVDLGTFAQGPPDTIDPGLNTESDGAQVIQALYDPLTEIVYDDDAKPTVVPKVAESVESDEEGKVWTFKIRDGLKFSNGEQVLPSSFRCAWERASTPGFHGFYGQMFEYVEGGKEKLAGDAETMSGLEADDETMTLTVTLAEPYADFDATVNHATWMPMPTQAILDLGADQQGWDRSMMVGNGAFKLDTERSDQEIVLVPNPEWDGTKYDEALGLESQPLLDKLTFRVSSDIDTAYNSFEAGEGQNGPVPPGRVEAAFSSYPNTQEITQLGTYYFQIGGDSAVAGDDNVLLRQAISQAINREELDEVVWEGSQPPASGMVPKGIPGYEPDICEFCTYDAAAAEAAFQEWQDAGNELSDPVQIAFNADAGHEDVVDIIADNLNAVGIDAEVSPMPSETYFDELSKGACIDICRVGWFADWPAYDNFLFELFHSSSGNNYGYDNPDFDSMVEEARRTLDEDAQGELYREAERLLLNEDIGAIPIATYAGQYIYADGVTMPYNNTNDIDWAKVSVD